MEHGESLTKVVRDATTAGLAEPWPLDDLSGKDAARKLLILARLAGTALELGDIERESLVPEANGSALNAKTFWEALATAGPRLAARWREALDAGRRLRYVATFADGGARIALEAVGPDHPCFDLAGADNLVAFFTTRYADSPLIVRGPGAGPDITAAGLFAEVLEVAALQTSPWK